MMAKPGALEGFRELRLPQDLRGEVKVVGKAKELNHGIEEFSYS